MTTRKTTSTPTDKVIRELMAGRHNERLLEIILAAQGQIDAEHVRLGWKLDIGKLMGGESDIVMDDDLSLDEAFKVERVTGGNWNTLQVRESAATARGVILVVAEHHGVDLDRLNEVLGAKGSLTRVLDCLTEYQRTDDDEAADPLAAAS